MKRVIGIVALSFIIVFSGFAQSKNVQGPKFKNSRPSERNEGNSSVLIRENPNQFQGPEYKNFNPKNYEKKVVVPEKLERPDIDLVVSTENKGYSTDEGKEKIIYRRVETKDMKGKNTKGLQGPAYKNYKP